MLYGTYSRTPYSRGDSNPSPRAENATSLASRRRERSTGTENRTPVRRLKVCRPRPLDDTRIKATPRGFAPLSSDVTGRLPFYVAHGAKSAWLSRPLTWCAGTVVPHGAVISSAQKRNRTQWARQHLTESPLVEDKTDRAGIEPAWERAPQINSLLPGL